MKTIDLNPRRLRPELLPVFTRRFTGSAPAEGTLHLSGSVVHELVADACAIGASDIHINPQHDGARVRIRVDGTVFDVVQVSIEEGKMLINQFKALANLDPIARFNPRDAHAAMRVNQSPINLRLALAPTLDRETLTVRILDPARLDRSISDLGFSGQQFRTLRDWLEAVSGMFITAGPTSSGKTTTLYAMLQQLKAANKVILTLEDPVEYQLDGIAQVQIDELHHLQFAEGLKALLRHDPDYLMLGEIRDPHTAKTAVTAAIAGRVLLSTLHARDCVGALTALRNWSLADHEIAESAAVIVAQRLMRKLCLNCCERRDLESDEVAWFEALEIAPPTHVWESKGCDHCHNLGYKGRTGVFELWRMDDSDYQQILRHSDEHRLRMHLLEKGHRFLAQEVVAKLQEGVTTMAEAKKVITGLVPHPAEAAIPVVA